MTVLLKGAGKGVTGGGGAPAPTAFVEDTFTGTAGTILSSHTGETGATWTRHTLSTANTLVISNANRLRAGANSVAIIYYASGTPTTAEYDVTVVAKPVTVAANSSDAVVAGRVDTAAVTMYCVRYVTATTNWRLTKFVAGTATDLDTEPATLTPNQDYTVKLEIRDAAKKVYVDGVEILTSADNTITAAGLVGFRMLTGTSGDAAGMHIDSISAVNA